MLIEKAIRDDCAPPPNSSGSGDRLRQQLQGKRLLIVDEALKTFMGHWFEYDRAVVEMNRDAGVAITLAAHEAVAPEIQNALGAVPTFRYTNWDGIYAYPQTWRRYLGILRHNWRVYRRLDRFLKDMGPYDCVFVPTTVLYHVIAWRFLLVRHGGRRFKHLVLFFRNDAGTYSNDKAATVFKKTAIIYGWVLRLFAGVVRRGEVRLVTDSERLAADYRLLSGIEFEVFPSPRISPPVTTPATEQAYSGVLTFSCLGPARFEKGIDVLQAAIKRVLAAEPDAKVRFIIQWNMELLDEHGSLYLPDPNLERDPRVTFLRDPLDSDAYAEVLAKTDCMLLPYRLASYYARISGVAVEAVTAGIPLIYTRASWIETLVNESGAGIGVDDGEDAGLASAILELAGDITRYRAEALVRCKIANETNAVSTFLEKLWGVDAS